MKYQISGYGSGNSLAWDLNLQKQDNEAGVGIRYSTYTNADYDRPPTRQKVLDSFRSALEGGNAPWIIPGFKEWILDLDKLKETFPQLSALDWLRGRIPLEPDVETRETDGSRDNRETVRRLNQEAGNDFLIDYSATFESRLVLGSFRRQ